MTVGGRVFRSLRHRNYRLFFIGHAISVSGEWAHRIGQAWLVLELTGSGTALGVTAALQTLPVLLIGPWGGLIADRIDKRRFLLWAQLASASLSLTLGVLTGTGRVEVWMVYALAFGLGSTKALEKPARDALIMEMVDKDDVANAVTLNSVIFSAAKTVGPAMAGVLITTVGLAASFYVNTGSYVAMVLALLLVRTDKLSEAPRAVRRGGQLRDGIVYAWRTPRLRGPLILMAVSGTFAYEWAVLLPLFARDVFGGDAQTFGNMFSAMGIGSVVGGLVVAGLMRAGSRSLLVTALTFGAVMTLTAFAPSLTIALAGLCVLGVASIAFRPTGRTLIQLRTEPSMRGRVVSLLDIALIGSSAVGGPLVGWLSEAVGIRAVFAFGGIVTMAAAIPSYLYVRRHRTESGPVEVSEPPAPDDVRIGRGEIA